VETALSFALTYVVSVSDGNPIKPSHVTILADSDYYSHSSRVDLPLSRASHQFLDFGVRLQDAHKTGLGSSAALVTAFTGAVLSHYLSKAQFDITSAEGKSVLHNLAQAAHCSAQGKVGSGFDVAAAVYGSCMYRRFSPTIMTRIGQPGDEEFSMKLREYVEDRDSQVWDTEIKKDEVRIPEGMALIMCDVDCGSQTVGMVKKVLQWKSQDPNRAKALWDELQARNDILAKELISGAPKQLTEAISRIRILIREMGEGSGVPIEPQEQTALLDALTSSVEGVYGGVVPGAGGYDAVVLLVKNDEETLSNVRSFLKDWSSSNGSNVKLLNVKGEMEGVRKEDCKLYGEWIK
jgi:phosphomevalonate kinase